MNMRCSTTFSLWKTSRKSALTRITLQVLTSTIEFALGKLTKTSPSNSSNRNQIFKVRHSSVILRLGRISAMWWTNMAIFTAGATTRMVNLALVTPILEPNLHKFEFSAPISNIWDANRCLMANFSHLDSLRRTCLRLRSQSRFCLSVKTTPVHTFPSVIRSLSLLMVIEWHPQTSRRNHLVSAWPTNLVNQGVKRMTDLSKTDFSHNNSHREISAKHNTRQPKTPSSNIASILDPTKTMPLNSRKPFIRVRLISVT